MDLKGLRAYFANQEEKQEGKLLKQAIRQDRRHF